MEDRQKLVPISWPTPGTTSMARCEESPARRLSEARAKVPVLDKKLIVPRRCDVVKPPRKTRPCDAQVKET